MKPINLTAIFVLLLASSGTVGQPEANEIVFYGFGNSPRSAAYSIRADGSGQVNLSNDPANSYYDPSWSADGSKIIHSRGERIWVMNADSSNPTQLTFAGAGTLFSPVYSPDSRKIAFIHDGNGFQGASILVRTLASGATTLLTFITPHEYSGTIGLGKIDWSPDGSRIVFSRLEENSRANLYVINADGTGEVRLTNAAFQEYNRDPNWSPDGSKIAYASERDVLVRPTRICIMQNDGSNNACITNDFSRDDRYPSWSPNGTRLAFSGYSYDTGRHQIYVVDATGANVVQVTQNTFHSLAPDWKRTSAAVRPGYDYDGDGRTDVSVFRPSEGNWYVVGSFDSTISIKHWGLNGDTIVPADYDGDTRTDLAIRRPGENNFYILNSSNETATVRTFGVPGDLVVPADYDGDGKAEVAVWRPSDGTWYLARPDGNYTARQWGRDGDLPAPADYSGDGRTDLAVFRPTEGNWYVLDIVTGAISITRWGLSGDRPVPGDYSGDGRADFAVYRPSDGMWYRLNSNDGMPHYMRWGLADDIPVPGDYDGDGKQDIAVWRPTDATWYVSASTSGIRIQGFGLSNDKPTPSAFVY